ncbi:Glycosyltransferase, GT2 family [Methylobacterium phyllostachyos]|uniref:Glycosyltransferase, GT2 family n=2 Tax=Methylobacterium phyllostachyos TaxID=582672 RepID=A0A1H0B1B0_9HYPH|nr:Glycosyltransferase, GT2 family [Methylobacterium phyllostachyos]
MPRFSVVLPAYRTPPNLLIDALNSLLCQTVLPAEIIVIDDSGDDSRVRDVVSSLHTSTNLIRLIVNETNQGISASTNIGIAAATGDFIVFQDHDDLLTDDALEKFSDLIDKDPTVGAIYSDQCTIDEQGSVLHRFFKPCWSPIYALGVMYPGHLLAVRSDLCRKHKILSQYNGVQDFEFLLRVSEDQIKISHVPAIAYKWRAIPGSLALGSDEKSGIDRLQATAVNDHLRRRGLSWIAESHEHLPHRLVLNPSVKTKCPKISIIIPSRNQGTVLSRCLESLFVLTEYPDFEVVLVDNRTTDPIALQAIKSHPVKHVIYDTNKFNYSQANNIGVSHASGEFIVFLNNDTEVITSDWLQKLVMYFEDPKVGATGATLLYQDRTIQHAGVVLGPRGTADHVMRAFPENADGYAGSLAASREVSAVTVACLMMRKSLFNQLRGFSEDYSKHYQDVDLCLKIRNAGLSIISVSNARLYHHESLTRKDEGYDSGDRAILLDRWGEQIEQGDPYYSKHFEPGSTDYRLRAESLNHK